MLKKYLPGRKVVALLIIPIISIALLFVLNHYLNNSDEDKNNLLEKQINKVVDTDGDGLEDWEEDLVGTDKNKKDTDGDGFSDMLEVRTGSDPLDPLNKEKKKKEIIKELESGSFDYDYRLDPTLNNTDRLAYQFLEEGVKLKKAGLSFNKDLQEQVANKIISNNLITLDLKKFSLEDLNISDVEIWSFKENLLRILNGLKKEKLTEESLLLNQYLEFKDEKYADEIKNNVKIYNKYIQKLLKIKVPNEVKDEYISFLNSFSAEVQVINYYTKAVKDPVSTVQVLAIYEEIDALYRKSLLKLAHKIN